MHLILLPNTLHFSCKHSVFLYAPSSSLIACNGVVEPFTLFRTLRNGETCMLSRWYSRQVNVRASSMRNHGRCINKEICGSLRHCHGLRAPECNVRPTHNLGSEEISHKASVLFSYSSNWKSPVSTSVLLFDVEPTGSYALLCQFETDCNTHTPSPSTVCSFPSPGLWHKVVLLLSVAKRKLSSCKTPVTTTYCSYLWSHIPQASCMLTAVSQSRKSRQRTSRQ